MSSHQHSAFLTHSLWVKGSWYLDMVLIFVSLLADEIEHYVNWPFGQPL